MIYELGDLVRVTKGHKLKPSPQLGDIGLIIGHLPWRSESSLEEETYIVMFANKPLRFWRVSSKNLEVINENR